MVWLMYLPVTPKPMSAAFAPQLMPAARSEAPKVLSGAAVSVVRASMPPRLRRVRWNANGRMAKAAWVILTSSTSMAWESSSSYGRPPARAEERASPAGL